MSEAKAYNPNFIKIIIKCTKLQVCSDETTLAIFWVSQVFFVKGFGSSKHKYLSWGGVAESK